MHIPFNDLPDHSRIWIYQADRPLTEQEEKVIREDLRSFCEQWTAHGHPLRTSFQIDRSLFLIVGVDEHVGDASGCSIDGSVRVLKSFQQRLGVDFLGRAAIPFLMNGALKFVPLRELRQSFTSGILGPTTLTFNLLAPTKGDWKEQWVLPAKKTWLAQYLPKEPVT